MYKLKINRVTLIQVEFLHSFVSSPHFSFHLLTASLFFNNKLYKPSLVRFACGSDKAELVICNIRIFPNPFKKRALTAYEIMEQRHKQNKEIINQIKNADTIGRNNNE
jgi:hypothetical protein